MKKDVSIQIVRILAMGFIVMCHLLKEFDNGICQLLSQVFNVGVHIFLIISGYLYGKKHITNWLNWIKERIVKVLLPMYILMAILLVVYAFQGIFEWKYVLIYLLNIQCFYENAPWVGYLWFMSVIMLCYFSIPILQKCRDTHKLGIMNLIWLILAICGTYIHKMLGLTLLQMQVFELGYTYQNKEEQSKISIWKVVLLVMFACVARVLGKIWLDETLLYDVIIATICHGILGFGIFYGVRWIVNKLKVPETKCVDYVDKISFYVYLTHCLFMKEPLPLLRCTSFFWINIILVLLATFASASVLYVVSTSLQKRILKKE